ncbi:unnamed protein product [Closterium sp. NIES-54]
MCSNLARKAAPHSFHVRIVAIPKIEAARCVTGVEVPSFARVVPAEVPSICRVRHHHSKQALIIVKLQKIMRVASSLIITAFKNTSAPNNHAKTLTNLSLGLNGGGFVGLILTVVEAVTAVGTVAAAVAGAYVGTARDCCCCARSSSAAFMELSSSLKTASFGVELLLASSTTGDSWRDVPRACRPFDRGPAALSTAAPPPFRRGPATSSYAALPPFERGPTALYYAALPPSAKRPCRPTSTAPTELQPSRGDRRAAESRPSRAAQQQLSRLSAAEPPRSCRAAQEPPSRPAAAEPPGSCRAAQAPLGRPATTELPVLHCPVSIVLLTLPTLPLLLALLHCCPHGYPQCPRF